MIYSSQFHINYVCSSQLLEPREHEVICLNWYYTVNNLSLWCDIRVAKSRALPSTHSFPWQYRWYLSSFLFLLPHRNRTEVDLWNEFLYRLWPSKSTYQRYTSAGFDKAHRTHVQALSSIKAFSDPAATFQRTWPRFYSSLWHLASTGTSRLPEYPLVPLNRLNSQIQEKYIYIYHTNMAVKIIELLRWAINTKKKKNVSINFVVWTQRRCDYTCDSAGKRSGSNNKNSSGK